MKSIIALTCLAFSLTAGAFQTGSGANGPYTIGPLGYTDPFVSSQGSAVVFAGSTVGSTAGDPSLGSSAGSSASLQMKAIAIKIINDAEDYFQNGSMTPALEYLVKNIKEQNSELSETEAVAVVVEFAHLHF